ncbi:hypothetical protein F511_39570 [Dorcoceras hygrometricum]|uniref:Uncharacterized protein n=1 Tax=Dorcoceras hygrometricum TaxID=472368 RepID=A0A2Z7CBL8_9LAMI|nr:hypothetical protein F511_39570 [Dorcoceras hygrometricum]
MSSPNDSRVSSTAASLDSVPSNPETREPWLSDQAELGSSNPPWYEEKSSNLRSSDIPFIKEKGGYERMGKTERLQLMEEETAAGSSGVAAPSKKATKKRRASTPAEKEARREKRKKKKEEVPAPEARGAPTSETHREVPSIQEPEARPIDADHQYSLGRSREGGAGGASGSRVVATNLLCHIAPNRDIDRLSGASNAEAVGLFSSNFAAAENLRRNFDDASEHYSELEKRLAEMEAARAEETWATKAHKAALETRGLMLEAERAALLSEKRALEVKSAAMKAELDETKARAAEEAERMRGEKYVDYFKSGFEGAVAQFRANGYPEEENPAPFLDAKKALRDMPKDEEEAAEEEDKEVGEEEGDDTPPELP